MAITKQPFAGHLGNTPDKKTPDYVTIDNKVCKIYKTVVYQFELSDVEDPILYAAEPIIDWQNSEQGSWVMKHAVEPPEWNRFEEAVSWTHKFYITAKLKDKDYTYFLLKWGTKAL